MPQTARHEPTDRAFDERLTRLERQVAAIAATITRANEAAANETHAFHKAFAEHREEARKALTATHELIVRLHAELQAEVRGDRLLAHQRHSEIMAEFEKLTTAPSEERPAVSRHQDDQKPKGPSAE